MAYILSHTGQELDAAVEAFKESGFVNKTVDDLVNYYKKNELYTKSEIDAVIANIHQLSFVTVESLPTTGNSSYIYLVPAVNRFNQNEYLEYIYLSSTNSWEMIGSTQVDLTGYATESFVNTKIADYYTKAEIDNLITKDAPYIGNNGNWYQLNPSTKQMSDTGISAKGDSGNVMYATFEIIDGNLYMNTPDGYTGPRFALDNDGNLEVII